MLVLITLMKLVSFKYGICSRQTGFVIM